MEQKKPELVCPAGDWTSMITAVESGADSVYFGIKGINMRARANNFDLLELKKVMNYLHDRNRKGFLALNVIVMNPELVRVEKILKGAREAGVDAIICWDMAVLSMALDLGLAVHLSTQASVSNTGSLRFYSGLGVKRVVLARECNLNQIREIVRAINEENLDCEIETFVHGAMCVSVSGRCFMSLEAFGKSANRGECMQPCRREFFIRDTDDRTGFVLGQDFVLSPKDLCTVDFLDLLMDAGIHSFKIEGRMRSKEYIRVVVSAYRRAIDAHREGKLDGKSKKQLKAELETVYSRGFSPGFYFGTPVDWISRKLEQKNEKLFLGEVVNFYRKIGVAELIIRSNELKSGDRIMVVGKHTPARFTTVTEMQQEHREVKIVKKGEAVGVKLPFTVRRKDQVFLWNEKTLKS